MGQVLIDLDAGIVRTSDENGEWRQWQLQTPEAFATVSKAWLRAGWDTKYVYSFTWLGRPIIQLPEDLIRLQEVIYSLKPDLIIETGVAHGGSLVFYASLCKLMGNGRVIGVDVEIRPHNRQAIEQHELFHLITLVEGDSVASDTITQVHSLVRPGERVMVFLDSCHTKAHVLAELEAYSPLVSVGSYIVAMDGIMSDLAGAPRGQPDWSWNNPLEAAREFVTRHREFIIQEPAFLFNEGMVTQRVTYWPSSFLKRIS